MPILSYPRPEGYNAGARALQELAKDMADIQTAADEAEYRQIKETTAAHIEGALKQTDIETGDPEVYQTTVAERMKEIQRGAIQGASNDRVRGRLEAGLEPMMIRGQTDALVTYGQKQVKRARSNSAIYLEEAQRRLSQTADPLGRQQIENEIRGHIGTMVGVQAYNADEGVQKYQKIIEGDSFVRAIGEIRNSQNPLQTLDELQRRYPDLDPNKIVVAQSQAQARESQLQHERAKQAKEVKDADVLEATIKATDRQMTLTELNERARAQRWSEDEYNKVKNAMERGGVTNAQVERQLELQILQGQLTDYNVVANNRQLNNNDASRLMRLIQQQRDAIASGEKHFTKTPEYQQAARELSLAITGQQGQITIAEESVKERYLFGLRQLYDRVENKEDPMAVSRELQANMTPKDKGMPLFFPDARYPTDQDLLNAYQRGEINRKKFNYESALREKWEAFKQQEAASQARRQQQGERPRR